VFIKIVVADERVSALDIIPQVRQRPLLEEAPQAADALLALALQHLQEKRELCHLHSLGIYVNPEDAALEDSLSLGCRQTPLAAAVFEDGKRCLSGPGVNAPGPPIGSLLRGRRQEPQHLSRRRAAALLQQRKEVCLVPFQMPVQQKLVGSDEKRARAAGRIEDSKLRSLRSRPALKQPSDGVLDDVLNDVRGRVVNPAGLPNLRLVLHDSSMPLHQPDDLP
jgi:hypothetical protein